MHRRSQTFTLASKILPKFSHRINVDAMNYKRLQRFRRIIGGDAPLIIESTYRSQQSCAPSSIFISIQWYIFAVDEGSSRQVLIERAASAWTSSVFPDVYETSEVRLRNVRTEKEVSRWRFDSCKGECGEMLGGGSRSFGILKGLEEISTGRWQMLKFRSDK